MNLLCLKEGDFNSCWLQLCVMGLELQDFFSCYDDAYVVIPSCLGCGIAS